MELLKLFLKGFGSTLKLNSNEYITLKLYIFFMIIDLNKLTDKILNEVICTNVGKGREWMLGLKVV